MRIFYAVPLCIFLCVTNRVRDNLDAVDSLRMPCEEERDRADTAIEVIDRLLSGQGRCLQRLAVELLALHGVDLIEAERGNAEPEAAEHILNPGITPERDHTAAENHICPLRVDIKADARDAGNEAKLIHELLAVRQLPAIDNEADEDLSGRKALPDQDVAQKSPAGRLVICGNLPFSGKCKDRLKNARVLLRREQTIRHGDERVRAAGVEPRRKAHAFIRGARRLHTGRDSRPFVPRTAVGDVRSLRPGRVSRPFVPRPAVGDVRSLRPGRAGRLHHPDRVLRLVAVAVGHIHADDRPHLKVRQTADARHRILHELPLPRKLRGVVHLLQAAAAAAARLGARSRDTARTGLKDLFDARKCVRLLRARHAGQHLIADQCVLHKQREAVRVADALAVLREIFDCNCQEIIFIHMV